MISGKRLILACLLALAGTFGAGSLRLAVGHSGPIATHIADDGNPLPPKM